MVPLALSFGTSRCSKSSWPSVMQIISWGQAESGRTDTYFIRIHYRVTNSVYISVISRTACRSSVCGSGQGKANMHYRHPYLGISAPFELCYYNN